MNKSMRLGAFATVGVIAIIFMVMYGKAYSKSAETVTITVNNKDRITESNGEDGTTSKYIVYAKGETFENTDDMFNGKYNSSDVQGALIRGKTYRVKVIGWRNARMSSYRNILEIIEEVGSE